MPTIQEEGNKEESVRGTSFSSEDNTPAKSLNVKKGGDLLYENIKTGNEQGRQ